MDTETIKQIIDILSFLIKHPWAFSIIGIIIIIIAPTALIIWLWVPKIMTKQLESYKNNIQDAIKATITTVIDVKLNGVYEEMKVIQEKQCKYQDRENKLLQEMKKISDGMKSKFTGQKKKTEISENDLNKIGEVCLGMGINK